ncbi:hypothetical protein M8C21_011017 [Ambrosia artemisiifolia]|uniref:Phytocyanin domain-containing protein n=1 Tax=Ambrosia artemisiifolia TaxID=4212 RepID=A0AAD5BKU6_AMBAR|nr:hypothetical protein M8C21_011017 [Ambrosia artemisiifolia]
MAAMKSSTTMFMIMFIVASMQMHSSMAQTRHVVGDTLGWTIPPNGAATYTTWASQQTFNVGDSLFFNFTTGFHDYHKQRTAHAPSPIPSPPPPPAPPPSR